MKYKAGVFVNFNGNLVRRSKPTIQSCYHCIAAWRGLNKLTPCVWGNRFNLESCHEKIGPKRFPMPLKNKTYNNIRNRV